MDLDGKEKGWHCIHASRGQGSLWATLQRELKARKEQQDGKRTNRFRNLTDKEITTLTKKALTRKSAMAWVRENRPDMWLSEVKERHCASLEECKEKQSFRKRKRKRSKSNSVDSRKSPETASCKRQKTQERKSGDIKELDDGIGRDSSNDENDVPPVIRMPVLNEAIRSPAHRSEEHLVRNPEISAFTFSDQQRSFSESNSETNPPFIPQPTKSLSLDVQPFLIPDCQTNDCLLSAATGATVAGTATPSLRPQSSTPESPGFRITVHVESYVQLIKWFQNAVDGRGGNFDLPAMTISHAEQSLTTNSNKQRCTIM